MLHQALKAYASYARLRFSKSPEALLGAQDFVARRTWADQRAILRRMELIAESDPSEAARTTRIPVHHLYGFFDPIVPWPSVTHWLQANCASLRGSRRILGSDHTVLATAFQQSAEQIARWMA